MAPKDDTARERNVAGLEGVPENRYASSFTEHSRRDNLEDRVDGDDERDDDDEHAHEGNR